MSWYLSLWYGHVTLVRDTLFWQLSIGHNMAVYYQVKHRLLAPTLARKLTFHIGYPVVRTDGRTVTWLPKFFRMVALLASLSSEVFEPQASTGSGQFAVLNHDFEQICFGQIFSVRVKAHFWLTCVAQKRYCLNSLEIQSNHKTVFNRVLHKTKGFFCVYKWGSSLFTGIVFKFHMHVHNFSKRLISVHSRGTSITFRSCWGVSVRMKTRRMRTSIAERKHKSKLTIAIADGDLFLRPSWRRSDVTDIVFTISATLAYFGDFFGN